jgi:predicted RNase H-like HicB family nuclease
MKIVKYGVVIEKGDRNCSAYVPDLPGCIATGMTVEETKERIKQAIKLHLKGMREDGEAIPEPRTVCDNVEVA